MFVVAAGVAAFAFVLSWMLPQLALRDSVTGSTGIGETFAVPKDTDSLAELSRALTVLVGREGRRRFVAQMAERAGVDLGPAECWVLVRLHFDPHADLDALSAEWGIPVDVAHSARDSLDDRGLLVHGDDGGLSPTEEGQQMVERLVAERRASLSRLLEGWAPEQQPELVGFLTRLANELVRNPAPEVAVPA